MSGLTLLEARKWNIWRIMKRNIYLKCGKWITTEISRRRFCLECCIKHTKIIRALKLLNLKSLFVFKVLSI